MYLIGEIQRHEERTRERSEKVKDSSIGKSVQVCLCSYRTGQTIGREKGKFIDYMWRLNIACYRHSLRLL